MRLFPRRPDRKRMAECVSRAEQLPGLDWSQDIRQLAAVGRLLEPAVEIDEVSREARKQAMLAEFRAQRGQHDSNEPRPVVISDVEAVDTASGADVAARFAELFARPGS